MHTRLWYTIFGFKLPLIIILPFITTQLTGPQP